MEEINKIIKKLYDAYIKKDLESMKSLIDEWKKIDTNNSYLKKYESLYDKLNSTKENIDSSEEKIVKFWWKTIKCTHCWSNLSLTENNKKVLEDYTAWITKELKFKCNYCATEFSWNDKWLKPIYLNISVWQEITLDNKKYRVSGGVRYIWSWQTGNSWKLEYIERILIDDKWDTYYLSESKAYWQEDGESGVEYQTEISRKIVPDFNLWELSEYKIFIDWNSCNITEVCSVVAIEAYWENSKSYTIWEEITTYQLKYKWKDYVFEKEKTNSQQEIWVYHTWEVNDRQLKNWNIGYNSLKLNNSFFGKTIVFSILLIVIWYFILNHEINIKEVTLADITNKNLSEVKWLYKVNFSDIYKKDISDSTTRYDYGWIRHNIKYLDWIKFKIETQNDLDILKKILSWELDIKSSQIPNYGLDFSKNTFSSYFTNNKIINFK